MAALSAHDAIEAELAVIGGLMESPPLREYCTLAPAQFFDPVLGRLYGEIVRRIDAGEVATAITLKAWAVGDPGASQVPNLLLTAIGQAETWPGYFCAYVSAIRDAHARREAVRVHSEALARLNAGDDVLAVLAESETTLRSLADFGKGNGARIAAAGASFIDGMDAPALLTDIHGLDAKTGGLHRGELTILAGRPSMGKTALANQIARNIAGRGKAVHFASLEMPKEQLACRGMSALSWKRQYGTERVEYYHLRNGSNVSRDLLRALAAELPHTLVIDDRAAQTLMQLEQSARATRRDCGRLDLIVVDYLQLMQGSRKNDGRVQEVSEISAGLKAIAKRLDCPVVALSQLSRGVESRENKRPQLADLRDSGSIEQDADTVLFVYRESYYLQRAEPPGDAAPGEWAKWKAQLEACIHDLELAIPKQRGGPTGTIKLTCHLEYDVVVDTPARPELRAVSQ